MAFKNSGGGETDNVKAETKGGICRIFIDGPNVAAGASLAYLRQIHWNVLIETLVKNFSHFAREAIAYVHPQNECSSCEYKITCRCFEKASIEVKCQRHGDVDGMIISDLKAIRFKKDQNVVIILVSGDNDFSDSLKVLRMRAERKEANLKIVIASWRDKFNRRLKKYADDIIFLESIKGIAKGVFYENKTGPKTKKSSRKAKKKAKRKKNKDKQEE